MLHNNLDCRPNLAYIRQMTALGMRDGLTCYAVASQVRNNLTGDIALYWIISTVMSIYSTFSGISVDPSEPMEFSFEGLSKEEAE